MSCRFRRKTDVFSSSTRSSYSPVEVEEDGGAAFERMESAVQTLEEFSSAHLYTSSESNQVVVQVNFDPHVGVTVQLMDKRSAVIRSVEMDRLQCRTSSQHRFLFAIQNENAVWVLDESILHSVWQHGTEWRGVFEVDSCRWTVALDLDATALVGIAMWRNV